MSKNLCIILDFDGVLTKLDINWKIVIERVSNVLGIKISSLYEIILKYWRTSLYNIISNVIEEFELQSLNNAKLIPTIEELNKLSKIGKLCIASLQSRKVIEKFLKKYGIENYFEKIMTRDDYPRKYMQIFKIINELNVSPENTILIDDLERNCDECIEIGIKCIIFGKETQKYTYFKSFKEILDYIERFRSN